MPEMTGHCLCGQIQYRVETDGALPTVCHCAGCRRASGAPAVAWITVASEAFRVTQGALRRVRASEAEPGTCDACGGERGFCPDCGSQITFTGDGGQQQIDITTGTLDDPDRFPPAEDVRIHAKVAWMKTLA